MRKIKLSILGLLLSGVCYSQSSNIKLNDSEYSNYRFSNEYRDYNNLGYSDDTEGVVIFTPQYSMSGSDTIVIVWKFRNHLVDGRISGDFRVEKIHNNLFMINKVFTK